MRKRTLLRMVATLLVCLLAGSVLSGALAAGPPGPPPPKPPPPEPPPPPEVHLRIIVPLPPEMDDGIRARISPEEMLRASRSLDDGSYLLSYDGKDFKTFINPEWRGVGVMFKIDQLKKGAFIGATRALVPFCIMDKAEGKCKGNFPAGDYFVWKAHAAVVLKIKPPPEMIDMNWFIAFVRLTPDGKIDIKAVIYYPDPKYRSPEEMLKAARSLDDGGILKPLPPPPPK